MLLISKTYIFNIYQKIMYKEGLKYSLTCLVSGLAIWSCSATYSNDTSPIRVAKDMAKYGVLETIIDDARRNAFPTGLISRSLTYIGLEGTLLFLIIPKKKKKEELVSGKKEPINNPTEPKEISKAPDNP